MIDDGRALHVRDNSLESRLKVRSLIGRGKTVSTMIGFVIANGHIISMINLLIALIITTIFILFYYNCLEAQQSFQIKVLIILLLIKN